MGEDFDKPLPRYWTVRVCWRRCVAPGHKGYAENRTVGVVAPDAASAMAAVLRLHPDAVVWGLSHQGPVHGVAPGNPWPAEG